MFTLLTAPRVMRVIFAFGSFDDIERIEDARRSVSDLANDIETVPFCEALAESDVPRFRERVIAFEFLGERGGLVARGVVALCPGSSTV